MADLTILELRKRFKEETSNLTFDVWGSYVNWLENKLRKLLVTDDILNSFAHYVRETSVVIKLDETEYEIQAGDDFNLEAWKKEKLC